MQAKTRIVQLATGRERKDAENAKTHVVVFDQSVHRGSFQELFLANYAAIRRECSEFAQPGLVIIAVHALSRAVMGSLCLAAKVGVPNSAIIGRHGMTDLYLDGDKSLSLRHLAVILSPLESGHSDIRFRVIDLHTSTAFQDEDGRRFESLVTEGPLFVRCGSYVLFCMPTGDMIEWPDRPADGWECIPERVFLRATEAEPDRWQRQKRADKNARKVVPVLQEPDGRQRSAVTVVHSIAGPVRARTRLLAAGEEALGTLRVSADAGVQTLVLGPRAAQQGVLLGRYERCDIDGANVLTNDGISRVHLLIIEIDERLYALDTGSTHGTWLAGESREVRIVPLESGTELTLGQKLATLHWSPA